ncbi:ATP-dependent DNA ligase [Phlegmacium glaucopus]|nr:ATP-dependent DNA ligase [Phlegmacium glaucopus]
MSKRSLSSGTPTKNKRLKSNQAQIDHFFASPKAKTFSHDLNDSVNQFQQGSSTKPIERKSLRSDTLGVTEVIDVDAFDVTQVAKPRSITEEGDEKFVNNETTPTKISARLNTMKVPTDTDSVAFLPLDINPITYDPGLPSSHSINAPYALLTHAFVSLSQTRSRVAIINILTNVLRTIILHYPTSLLPAVYLLSNALGPQFIPIELGLGASIISRSIQQISGLSAAALRRLYTTTGDVGDVAFAAKSNIRTLIPHAPLTVPYVYQSLLKIARCRGQGAGKERQKIVEKLLLSASGEEVRYLTRTLSQNLRVGAVRTSILCALARAMVLTPKPALGSPSDPDQTPSFHLSVSLVSDFEKLPSSSKGRPRDSTEELIISHFKRAESLMKQVYVRHPSYDKIIPALLQGGLDSLAQSVPLTVGVPLHPMLGSPTRSLEEIYDRLGDLPFTAEFKYDGQRAQIHAIREAKNNLTVKIFSRHLEDMTSKYPDIINAVMTMLEDTPDLTSFIMDAEIVAIDPMSGELKSFQELSNRARKDVNIKDIHVAVCIYAFDLMFLNGEPLLEYSFRERRNLLRERFRPLRRPFSEEMVAQFDFVESCESTDGKPSVEDFLVKAIENKCEGLMFKILDKAKDDDWTQEKQTRSKPLPSTYEPDVRTSAWLKLKKDYIDGIGDSLDLVPVGAWHGNGRKAQWWSPVLLALWDPATGRLVAVCKCMSGFTDAFYKDMKQRYNPADNEVGSKQPKWAVDFGGFKPDVYFKPQEVWEIRGADVTESPVSVAALGLASSTRGLSLRFPRFIKVRDDKSIAEANTPSYLAEMWRGQQGKGKNPAGNDDGDLMDAEAENSDGWSDEYEEEEGIVKIGGATTM